MAGRYGSDVAVELLARLGCAFMAENPGASLRGLHDSAAHHAGPPEVIQCLHEEIAVAAAHGYAKAAGRPMAVALHDVVGLQHGAMAVFNAWCDRAPMLVLGGTGPMDAARRRPGIDWVHTALVQGNLVRDFVKWDDQPCSPGALVDSLLRAWRLAVTEPAGPVYVCLDVLLQEDPVPEAALPDPARFAPGRPPGAEPGAIRTLAGAIKGARWPVVVADRAGRSEEAFRFLGVLAERWALPVIDRGGRLNLPTDHPMNLTGAEKEVLARADVILGLDTDDLYGALAGVDRTSRRVASLAAPGARVFAIGLADYGVRSLTADFQMQQAVEMSILADTGSALPALIEELGRPPAAVDGRREEIAGWHRALRSEWLARAQAGGGDGLVAPAALAFALGRLLTDRDYVVANGELAGWTRRILDLSRPRQFLGRSGGSGLGYGIGATIGACLAHRDAGRIIVDIQRDGDFLYTPQGLWTLAHHRLPALIVMFNNRAYHNTREHQTHVATSRERGVDRAVEGTRLDDPAVDFAALARSMGVAGIGPVADGTALAAALQEALAVVEAGRPALVDVVTRAR